MIKLALLVAITAVIFYGSGILSDNPLEIESPVYMESRVNIDIPNTSRELEVVFIGEMASQDDCTERRDYYLDNLLENCQQCNIKLTECKLEIHSRYKKLFSDRKTHTTYLSLNKGSRFERNARLVVWGLNDAEAQLVCADIKAKVTDKYKGTAECI